MTEHPPLYTMTWGEVEERALRGETLTTSCGYLVCGRDRKYRELGAYAMFRQDVSEAIERGREVHPENLKVNLKQRHPVNKVNKKGRPFSWSYSALSNFTGCPKRYAHEKFWCDVPWVDTDAIIFGNRVHTACEQAVKGEAVKEPGLLAPVQKYIDLFRKRGAEAELEIVLDRNCKPVKGKKAWFSEKAWFRAKLDVVLTDGVKAGIYDWKTGEKVRDDTEQLKNLLLRSQHRAPGTRRVRWEADLD